MFVQLLPRRINMHLQPEKNVSKMLSCNFWHEKLTYTKILNIKYWNT